MTKSELNALQRLFFHKRYFFAQKERSEVQKHHHHSLITSECVFGDWTAFSAEKFWKKERSNLYLTWDLNICVTSRTRRSSFSESTFLSLIFSALIVVGQMLGWQRNKIYMPSSLRKKSMTHELNEDRFSVSGQINTLIRRTRAEMMLIMSLWSQRLIMRIIISF